MKIYIIKPKTKKINKNIIQNFLMFNPADEFTDNINEADKCILQKGWTTSKYAMDEYIYAHKHNIPCIEGYIYTDLFHVHLN